ncbi:hypothetical protein lerEdw1_016660 [Lerista edwardsae]|nr:hypothetical protein lerEdw1_016660 [Lerista edwardsae]
MAAPASLVLLPLAVGEGPTKLRRHSSIFSHKKYRALLKKEKRKKKRQALARLRDSEKAGKDEKASEEEELDEEEQQLEEERQRLHEEWLLREERAQEAFRIKKEKEDAARKRQEEEEQKIKEEWEEQQRKEQEEEERKQQAKKDREEAVQKMLDQAESQLENGSTWHNPEPPENIGTERDRANCPFYIKTGACRFGDRCSRKHNYPSSSQTLLIRGMFVTFGMEQCKRDDYDTDASLEYSEEEIYQQFLDFYEDVLPEFKNVGKVIQFKVCLKDKSVREGSTATFFMYSEIPTMSSGKPTEIFIFPLSGLNRQVKTLTEEIEWDTMKNIIAGQGEGAIQAQIILTTKEMENLKGKRVITSIRKGTLLRGHEVEEDGGHTARRKEEGVVTGAQLGVAAEVLLGQGVEAERGLAAEEEIAELFLEHDFSRCVYINSTATRAIAY